MNRVKNFYDVDQRDEPLWQVREQMDATDPQPATSEMLCGFVLGCVCSAVVLWIWGIKF